MTKFLTNTIIKLVLLGVIVFPISSLAYEQSKAYRRIKGEDGEISNDPLIIQQQELKNITPSLKKYFEDHFDKFKGKCSDLYDRIFKCEVYRCEIPYPQKMHIFSDKEASLVYRIHGFSKNECYTTFSKMYQDNSYKNYTKECFIPKNELQILTSNYQKTKEYSLFFMYTKDCYSHFKIFDNAK